MPVTPAFPSGMASSLDFPASASVGSYSLLSLTALDSVVLQLWLLLPGLTGDANDSHDIP
jgi:hypothetical protein